jgi:creatinine amidohydrolase
MSPFDGSTPKSIYEMTWRDVEALLASGCTSAIVPMGQVAQHGPHLPLGSDAIQARELSRRIVARLGQDGHPMLLGPTVPFGHSPTHHRFPGTVELEPETLALVIRDIGRSLVHQGFDHLVLLCCGGGNWAAVENAAYHLWRDGAKVFVLGYFEAMSAVSAPHLDGPGRGEHDGHAAELETSCVLAVAPGLVDMSLALNHQSPEYRELAELPFTGFNFNELSRAAGLWDVRALGDNGVWGNATLGTAEKGERLLSDAADLLARHLRKHLYGAGSGEPVTEVPVE